MSNLDQSKDKEDLIDLDDNLKEKEIKELSFLKLTGQRAAKILKEIKRLNYNAKSSLISSKILNNL